MFSLILMVVFVALGTNGVRGQEGSSREDAFIGYSERALDCQDRLDNCREKAHHNGCILDPYNMRTFCPISCAVSRCLSTGTLKVRHRGHATPDDTALFVQRFAARVGGGAEMQGAISAHFRKHDFAGDTLELSSLGMGTYLGEMDGRTDDAVASAAIYSVARGWNVIDTASNYRWGRAETSIGAALDSLLAGTAAKEFLQESEYSTDVTRSMLFISTKAGFTDEDLVRKLVKENKLSRGDVVNGHTLAPNYIMASVNVSLERLNLETVDLVYLHNAPEMQLRNLGWEAFRTKLKEAFRALEALRSSSSVRYYGLATWDCLRVPSSDPGHISLQELVALAKEVAPQGGSSGFVAVQLPVSASMTEAWLQPWQQVGNESLTLMQAAEKLGLAVFTSGPLGEGEVLRRLNARLDGIAELRRETTTAQKLLQLARSTPGAAMVSALVGHKTREYVVANTQLTVHMPLREPTFLSAMEQVLDIIEGREAGSSVAGGEGAAS